MLNVIEFMEACFPFCVPDPLLDQFAREIQEDFLGSVNLADGSNMESRRSRLLEDAMLDSQTDSLRWFWSEVGLGHFLEYNIKSKFEFNWFLFSSIVTLKNIIGK